MAMEYLMTLFFLHPELLFLPALVAAGGWFLLPRRGITEHPFTILEFWPEESYKVAGRWNATPDWPWILILIAAVLAALALCSPRLQTAKLKHPAAPSVTLHAVGRSIPQDTRTLDVFIQGRNIPRGSDYQVILTGGGQILQRTVSAEALKAGIDISPLRATPTITIVVKHNHRVIAQEILLHISMVRIIAGHFIGTPPTAFLRLFAALPQVTLHGNATDRSIWIVHQGRFNPRILHGVSNSTIVLLGPTPGPGLSPRAEMTLHPSTPLTALNHHGFMHAVVLSGVMVRKLFTARLDSHWESLITIQGRPWLAERNDATHGQTWLWVAGPMDWTTWPDHASFVIFFANVLAHLQNTAGADTPGNWWRAAASPTPRIPHRPTVARRSTNLNMALAVLACACLLMATAPLAWRTRTA